VNREPIIGIPPGMIVICTEPGKNHYPGSNATERVHTIEQVVLHLFRGDDRKQIGHQGIGSNRSDMREI